MAKDSIEERLVQAERHVEHGWEQIVCQQEFITELEANGHIVIANQARSLLRALLAGQAVHKKDRDRLKTQVRQHC